MSEDPDDTQRLVDRFVAQYREHGVESIILALVMTTKHGAANPAIVAEQIRAARARDAREADARMVETLFSDSEVQRIAKQYFATLRAEAEAKKP